MCLANNIRRIRFDARFFIQCQMGEELDIAFGSLYRRKRQTQNLESDLLCQRNKIIQNFLMGLRFTNYALFANLILAGFKLRLNKTQDLSCGF